MNDENKESFFHKKKNPKVKYIMFNENNISHDNELMNLIKHIEMHYDMFPTYNRIDNFSFSFISSNKYFPKKKIGQYDKCIYWWHIPKGHRILIYEYVDHEPKMLFEITKFYDFTALRGILSEKYEFGDFKNLLRHENMWLFLSSNMYYENFFTEYDYKNLSRYKIATHNICCRIEKLFSDVNIENLKNEICELILRVL